MSGENSYRILVVCLGNICRSPAGEAALREAADEAGVALEVDSAGTGPWHVGDPPHPQSVAAGKRAGLNIGGTVRQVTSAEELAAYDLVLAMDRSNLADLIRMAPAQVDRIRLFRSFDPTADSPDMPDPYGMSDAHYDDTVRWARSGARAIVDALVAGQLR